MSSQKTHVLVSFLSGALGAFLVILVSLSALSAQGNLGLFMQRLENSLPPVKTSKTALPEAKETSESQVVNTVKKVSPAVVSIVISKDVPTYEQYFDNNSSQDPFSNFFGFPSPFDFQTPQYRQNGTQKQDIGGGSGFLVSGDGLIVTNKHVVDQQDAQYTVFTTDGAKYDAKVIARDPVNDLAIIKIEGKNFPFLKFGDSDHIDVGQSVIAIGYALAEFKNTVSVGVVSGLSRSITAGTSIGSAEHLEGVIQTDAAINPGNSGGPLLNLSGEVIGVNVAIAQGSQNIGFALPAKLAQNVVTSVQKNGKIVRPYLGVRYIPITEAIKQTNKLSVDYGVLVVRGDKREDLAVIPGSPADKAGLMENDIILEADGKKLNTDTSLAVLVRQKNVGDKVSLKILHKGEEKTIEVTLQAIPD